MKKNLLLNVTLLPMFFLMSFGVFHSTKVIEEQIKHSTKITQVIDSISEKDSTEILIEQKEEIRQQLIAETKEYILKTVPKAHSNVDIIAPHLVDQSLGNNIDLCFILAQCKIETAFGTAGMGRSQSKKSMFGINKTYRTYEECIDHYIANLKKNYLSKSRTIFDLMKHYVTHNGHRYAADPKYEPKLQNQYHEIKKKTQIDNLEQEYRELNSLINTLSNPQNIS